LPKYKDVIGNPVTLPKSYFSTLRKLNKDFGARSEIKKKDIVTVNCDFGTVFDIDTSNALSKANLMVKN
jgi:CTP:molybdopterin cytidylyltransferase MocA